MISSYKLSVDTSVVAVSGVGGSASWNLVPASEWLMLSIGGRGSGYTFSLPLNSLKRFITTTSTDNNQGLYIDSSMFQNCLRREGEAISKSIGTLVEFASVPAQNYILYYQ